MTSGCASFIGDRIGARVGASIAQQVPTPSASTATKTGGSFCQKAAALGWDHVKLSGVTGPDAAIDVIGATREAAKACQ